MSSDGLWVGGSFAARWWLSATALASRIARILLLTQPLCVQLLGRCSRSWGSGWQRGLRRPHTTERPAVLSWLLEGAGLLGEWPLPLTSATSGHPSCVCVSVSLRGIFSQMQGRVLSRTSFRDLEFNCFCRDCFAK